jgi:hypothetical protein
MSKAEDRALEAYPIVISQHSDNCKEYDSNESDRLTFIEGYHQAEKDLELTVEDIVYIIETYNELEFSREFATVTFNDTCKEVLKRFKEIKK